MTENRSYLTDYKEIDGGFVAFGDFKLTDESHVLLKVHRKDNMYNVDLKNVVPIRGLTSLFAKVTSDESNLWHMRLGHINFKTINKLVKRNLVRGIDNLIDLRVKVIRCNNRTEFKDRFMNQFCEMKVSTACYVQKTVLVIKPHNKTPYERFLGRKPALSFMRPFGCPVTILNTIDYLGSGPNCLLDIDALTKSINYKPVVVGNQSNGSAGTKACDNVGQTRVETIPNKEYTLLPLWTQDPSFSFSSKDSPGAGFKPSGEEEKKDVENPGNEDSKVTSTEEPRVNQEKDANVNNANNINTVSLTDNADGIEDNVVDENIVYGCADEPNIPDLEEIGRFGDDKKKVIITEATISIDLQLEDAEGVDCLPNAEIFEQLTLMEYENLSQKLTFYKALFSPQWKFLIHTILQCLSAKTTA
nr:ribonuclease H-like domain-containing protein [Tanacetum cinerariifolium]